MAYLSTSTDTQVSGTNLTFTVPSGVGCALIHVAWAASTNGEAAQTVTVSGGAGTYTNLYPSTTNANEGSALYKVVGPASGDTITITVARNKSAAIHYLDDSDVGVVGSLGTRSGSSTATVAPTTTVTAGQTVYMLASERTTTTGTTVSSVVNANGDTVTQDYYADLGGTPNVSFYLGHFTEPTTSTGTTTITYNNGGTNGFAIHVAALVAAPAYSGSASFSGTGTLTASAAGSVSGSAALSGTGTLSASGVGGYLTSAVAGGVGTTTAKVRVDGTPGATVTVTAATNTALTTGAVTSSSITLDSDGLGIATLTGLAAGTDYYFGTTINGTLTADRGQFRTAATGAYSYSFATASCCANNGNPTVLDSIRTRVGPAGKGAEFFAHLGDIHYRERNTTATATILADWRTVLATSGHKALFSTVPVEYAWSDHDLGPDNSDSTSLGAGVMAAERATYARYFPTYDLPAVDTDAAPYRSWVRGRVRFTMTDGRTYMSAIAATDDSSKTKLGATQKQWLKDEWMAAKSAGQAIVWLHEDGGWTASSAFAGDDTWAAYTTERTELANFITSNGLANRIALVHGDFHAMGVDDGTNSPGGIPVMCAAPLQQTYFMPSQERWSGGKYPTTSPGTTMYQYGWFDVTDTGGTTLTIAFTGYSNDNTGGTSADTARLTQTITLATNVTGTAAFSGTGTLTAAGSATSSGSASFSGTGTLSVTGSPNVSRSAAFSGTGTLAATATPAASGAASLSGTGTLTATGSTTGGSTATFSGTGTLTATGAPGTSGAASLSGTGTLTATGTPTTSGTASFSGSGTLTASAAGSGSGSAAFSGSGTLTATGIAAIATVAALSGTGTLTATGGGTGTGGAAFSGTGTLTAQVTALTLRGIAALSGIGALTATGSGHTVGEPTFKTDVTITLALRSLTITAAHPATSITLEVP